MISRFIDHLACVVISRELKSQKHSLATHLKKSYVESLGLCHIRCATNFIL